MQTVFDLTKTILQSTQTPRGYFQHLLPSTLFFLLYFVEYIVNPNLAMPDRIYFLFDEIVCLPLFIVDKLGIESGDPLLLQKKSGIMVEYNALLLCECDNAHALIRQPK